jgi:hypothetical protein
MQSLYWGAYALKLICEHGARVHSGYMSLIERLTVKHLKPEGILLLLGMAARVHEHTRLGMAKNR